MSVMTITKDNFDNEVMKSSLPVLLDFWAPWCGPCRMVAPVIEEIADEVVGKAKVGKVNVDDERELAQAFRVMSIPTLAVVRDGKVTELKVGARDKATIKRMLDVK